MDRVSPEVRSRMMSRVRSRNTAAEIRVRSYLHRAGFRYRLHEAKLPGSPDIVLPKYRAVVFVHGCFWHQHPGCPRASLPKSNTEFWRNKLSRNIERDLENRRALESSGWKVFVVWTCEIGKERLEDLRVAISTATDQ